MRWPSEWPPRPIPRPPGLGPAVSLGGSAPPGLGPTARNCRAGVLLRLPDRPPWHFFPSPDDNAEEPCPMSRSAPRSRIRSLAGLRFFAAMHVLAFHTHLD